MAKFHRFSAPGYATAPTLGAPPGGVVVFEGVSYDLFNVTDGGVGAGGSSFMDAYKADGPNVGTYAVAFGEDATAKNFNRGLRAVAENTDTLDDLFHRDIALPLVTSPAVAGLGVTTIALPADTYVGDTIGYDIDMLFSVVDDSDREIINPTTGAKISVASIAGAVIGDGFSGGIVTLTLSEALPTGVTYKVYYATRGNLATMPTDSLSYIRVRGAEEVSAEIQRLLLELHGGVLLWNDPWPATITDLNNSVNTLDSLVVGGIHFIKEETPRTDLALIDPAALLTGELRLVPGSGLYRLKKGLAGDDGAAQWIIESSVSGTDRWENVLMDRLGVAYGFAMLAADGYLAQYRPNTPVVVENITSAGTATGAGWGQNGSTTVAVKSGDKIYVEGITTLVAGAGDTIYAGFGYELNGGGRTDPTAGTLAEFSTTATTDTRGVFGGVITAGADGTMEIFALRKGTGSDPFGSYDTLIKVTVVRP